MKEKSPIVYIAHELDGDWQFVGQEPIEDYTKIAMVVSLQEIIKSDKSVLKMADLPPGYQATRNQKLDKWTVVKIEYSPEEIRQMGYYCSQCGIYHKEIPMAYGSDAPYDYFLIPEAEREQRSQLTGDQCIINNREHFLRGCIEIMVEDRNEVFRWNVWVSISKDDFEKSNENWENENRVLEPPYEGKLSTHLEVYPETRGLAVKVITGKPGYAPVIELQDSDHPLFLEQENGINMDRVVSFAKQLLYNH